MTAIATGEPSDFGTVLEHLSQASTNGLRSRTAVVLGSAGAGKTYLLTQLLARFADRAVMLDPPPRAEDSAEYALSQLADGLLSLGRLPSAEHEALRDAQVPFEEKLRRLRRAADDPDVMLLCDGWGFWEQGTTDEARARSVQVIDALGSLSATCIVAGPMASTQALPSAQIQLAQARETAEAHASRDWGLLQQVADTVAGRLRESARMSPLIFRLAVALTWLRPSLRNPPWNAKLLAQALHDALPASSPLKAAWRSLAVLRAPADDTLVAALTDHVGREETAVLEYCLLDRHDPRGRRLGTLVRQVVAPRTGHAIRDRAHAHRTAATRYADLDDRLFADFERFHHFGRAGDIRAALERPLFQEQLHELGWWLSTVRKDYRAAVDVFTEAIARNATDAYAHHYRAFNLDTQGKRWRDAEHGYLTALRLQPQRPWSHSRYIRFLIALGRIEDARAAWERAQAELGTPEPIGDWQSRYYAELHEDVATALLDVNEVEFATMVLSDIPSEVAESRPSVALLKRRADKLSIGRTELSRYVPIANLSETWTSAGPFKLPQRLPGHHLGEWWAGRVDAIEGGDALISAAAVRPAESAVEELTAEVSLDQLAADAVFPLGDLRVGSFIEIGFYRRAGDSEGNALVLTATNDDRDESSLALRRPFPDAFRYARRTLSGRRRV